MTHGKSTGGAKLSAHCSSLDGAITNQISSSQGVQKVLDRRMFARAALGAIVLNETFGNASTSLADDRTVSAKVISVDADKATITDDDASYNVLAKAQVKINGKRGTFADIKPGHDVKLAFNTKKLVIRIEATGEPNEALMAGLPRGQIQSAVREGDLSELPQGPYSKFAVGPSQWPRSVLFIYRY